MNQGEKEALLESGESVFDLLDAQEQLAAIKRQVVDSGSLNGMKIEYREQDHRFYVYDRDGGFLWSGEATYNAWQCARLSAELAVERVKVAMLREALSGCFDAMLRRGGPVSYMSPSWLDEWDKAVDDARAALNAATEPKKE